MLEDSGKFFVLETKTGREIMDMASISFKDNFLNYKENASSMRKALLAFLSMRAYRKIKGINNPDINSLFKEDLVNLHSRLLQKAEFKNNALLRALIADKIPFGEKNRSNLKGLTLHKLAFNSRTKNNPDYVERLIDDFKLLATSPDPEAKHFAAEAFMYLMMKDAGLFKSDTFIRQIAPIFLKNVSVGLDKVQDLFSNGKGTFEEVFDIPKEKLVHEFVELFARYAPNNFYLKGNKLDVILSVNSSKEAIAEIRRLESLEEATSEDVKAVVKEEAPAFYDGIKQTLTFNLKKGVKKGATAEEIKRIMGINKSILGTTGLFDEKGGKIIYPPFIQVTMRDGEGGATKVLFKLDILHTGNEIKLDENGNVITDPTYSRNTSANNLFASEMTGGAATYIPVNPYLEKSIAPWFWTTEELEVFRIQREAEQSNDIDAEIASAEEATTEEQNDFLAAIAKLKQSFNPLISPSVTPAASDVSSFFPTSSQPSTSPKQEESSVSADELLGGMAGIRKKLQQKGLSEEAKNRIKNIGKNLKPGTTGESKSSSKQPINQAALTNILDKLSNKFGISWKYDTSIPGLGQFKDGVVLINPNKAKLDTPFHEFAHPFIAIIKIQNPLLYKNLVSQISKTEIGRNTFDKVKKLYPELTYEQQLEETIVDLIGQYAADQQSLKQEKGLWNAIKTFLRRVSEYLKSLLSNENKKVIPSELDPNTTMEELSSMLVIDNPIDLGTMLGKGYKKPAIKPGVEELFDSNPELANQVYEALGFQDNMAIPDYEVVTRPSKDIGKSKGRSGNFVEITTPDNYRTNMSAYMVQTNNEGKLFITDIEKYNEDSTFKGFGTAAYVDFFENYKNQGITTDTKLTKDGIKLLERLEKIGLVYKTDAKLIDGTQVSKVFDTKIYEYNKPLYEFNLNWKNNQITPQQKQQALQLYSQYLDTIFPDSKVKDIVYHGTEDKFDKFDIKFFGKNDYGDLGKGFYFAFNKESIFNEPIVVYAVIDDKNSKQSPGYEIMIPSAEQIHILGNKQDIEGFKEFVNNPVQRVNLDKPTTLFNIFANVADSDVIELINNCN
jgi:hypothetical protein